MIFLLIDHDRINFDSDNTSYEVDQESSVERQLIITI